MKKQYVLDLVKKVVLLLMAVCSILAFRYILISNRALVVEGSVTGFELMFFKNVYYYEGLQWLKIITGPLCLFAFAIALTSVIFAIINLICKNKKKALNVLILIGTFTVVVLYLIYGLALVLLTSIHPGLDTEYISTTKAYMPLIWQSILFFAYFIVPTIINRIMSTKEQNTQPEEKVVKTKSNKEQLQELKEMLDNGLISQEDFEQKKKQILGL